MTHPKWALPLAGRLVLTGVTAVWVTGVLSFLIAAGSPLVAAWQAAKLQRIAKDEFSAQFALSLALKDVHLALQAAGEDRFAALACLAARVMVPLQCQPSARGRRSGPRRHPERRGARP